MNVTWSRVAEFGMLMGLGAYSINMYLGLWLPALVSVGAVLVLNEFRNTLRKGE